MAVITLYVCPTCNNNVKPWLALITEPVIRCSRCKSEMNASSNLVVANWMDSFYRWALLVLWAFIGLYVVLDSITGNHDLVAAAACVLFLGWVPAAILAVPFIFIGYIAGNLMASRFETARVQANARPPQGPDHYLPQEHDWR